MQRRSFGENNHSTNLSENIQATNENLELNRVLLENTQATDEPGIGAIGETNHTMIRPKKLSIDRDRLEETI